MSDVEDIEGFEENPSAEDMAYELHGEMGIWAIKQCASEIEKTHVAGDKTKVE